TAFAEPARRALSEAGDRAFALNAFTSAAKYFSEALALPSAEDPGHADLLFRRARTLHFAAAEGREQALLDARDALLAAGDRATAAEAEAFLSNAAWYRGSRD